VSVVWQKIVELIKQIAGNPATRRFAEDVKSSVIDHLIAWLEAVLKGRRQEGPATA
jgi:hypothetical protein